MTIDLYAVEMDAPPHLARVYDVQAFAPQLLRDAMIVGGWLKDEYGLDEGTETKGEA